MSRYIGAGECIALAKVLARATVRQDGVIIKPITDVNTTMADLLALVNAGNANREHFFFDTSAISSNAYMITATFDDLESPTTYRIADYVTSRVGSGLYNGTDLLSSALAQMTYIGGDETKYGVRWDKTSAQMVRYGKGADIVTDTTNFTYNGAVNTNYDNPFDFIYPWSGKRLCNIDIPTYMALQEGDSISDCITAWEGDSNFSFDNPYGVWTYTPEFYANVYDDGTYRYFEVSADAIKGFTKMEESVKGRWVGGKVVSLTIGGNATDCLVPVKGTPTGGSHTLAQLHTTAKNYGATLENRWTYDATTLLYLVEFANWNSQAKLGNGVSGLYEASDTQVVTAVDEYKITLATDKTQYIENANIVVGTKKAIIVSKETVSDGVEITLDTEMEATDVGARVYIYGLANFDDGMGSKSGYIGTNGTSHAYYRGEEIFGNMYHYILGIYRDGATNHVWVAASPEEADNYDALDSSVHTDTGIVLADTSNYVKALGFSSAKKVFAMPCCTEVPGSSSAPVGDYHYVDTTTATRLLAVGGRAADGSACGFAYGDWRVTSGGAYWNYVARPNLFIP